MVFEIALPHLVGRRYVRLVDPQWLLVLLITVEVESDGCFGAAVRCWLVIWVFDGVGGGAVQGGLLGGDKFLLRGIRTYLIYIFIINHEITIAVFADLIMRLRARVYLRTVGLLWRPLAARRLRLHRLKMPLF